MCIVLTTNSELDAVPLPRNTVDVPYVARLLCKAKKKMFVTCLATNILEARASVSYKRRA